MNPSDPMEFNWNYTCYGQYIYTNMFVWPGTTITWQDAGNSGGITWWQNGNNITFYFSYPDAYAYFSATATNACGSSTVLYRFLAVSEGNCGGPPLRIYLAPNPTIGEVQISLAEKNDKEKKKLIYEVRILDKLGNVKRQYRYFKGWLLPVINISILPTDVYAIMVFDGKEWLTTKLVKQ